MPHADCCNDRSDLLNKSITMVSNEVITEPAPAKYRHLSPEEELARSRKLLAQSEPRPSIPLTVGDLSWATRRRMKLRAEVDEARNLQQGLTVGDLSWATKRRRQGN